MYNVSGMWLLSVQLLKAPVCIGYVLGMWLLSVQLLKAPVCIGYVVAFGPVVEGPGYVSGIHV